MKILVARLFSKTQKRVGLFSIPVPFRDLIKMLFLMFDSFSRLRHLIKDPRAFASSLYKYFLSERSSYHNSANGYEQNANCFF